MRKIKFWVFTIAAILALVSIRDKEIVLNVPSGKPLIAEAYHSPAPATSQEASSGLSVTPRSSSLAAPNNIPASSNNNSDYYNPNIDNSGGNPYTPPQNTNLPTPGAIPNSPFQAANQAPNTNQPPMYYGLGVYDPSATNTNSPQGGSNSAPVISAFSPGTVNLSVNWGTSIFFSVTASDPDSDTLSYSWQLDGQDKSDNTNQWTYNPDSNSVGPHTIKVMPHTIKVIVSDGSLSVEQDWAVVITNAAGSNSVFVTNVTPSGAIPGVSVIIQGARFSATASENAVKFGSVSATSVTVISQNQIRAVVPSGLPAGFTDLSVTVDGIKSSNYAFDILKDTSAQVFIDDTQNLNITNSSIVKAADVDNDKDMDLLVVDTVSNKFYLLINDSSGHFTDESASRLPASLNGLTDVTGAIFADVNNDGYPDLLITCSSGQSVRLFLNNGSGVFADVTSSNLPSLSGHAVALDAGDVNGDGYLDIIVACNDTDDFLLVNDGTGKFVKDAQFNLPAVIDGSSDIKFCDVNGDGALDIVTTNNQVIGSSDLRSRIYLNNGSGAFTDATDTLLPAGNDFSEMLDSGDIAHSGYTDIVVANYGQNAIFINQGGGVFNDMTSQLMPTNYFHSNAIKLGDMNGDGFLDLVILGDNKISLLLNDTHGSFKTIDASIKLPDYTGAPANVGGKNFILADVNGDGALDIIAGGDALRILTSGAVNKAPVLDPIGGKTVAINDTLTFNIHASDPNGDPLVYSYSSSNLPAAATLGAHSGVFNWTPGGNDTGNYNVTFTATEDRADNPADNPLSSIPESITIQVLSNTGPVLNVTPDPNNDIYLYLDESVEFQAKATGANTPIGITWMVDGHLEGGIPNDFSIFAVAFGSGDHTVVATATDNSGASSSVMWHVHVFNSPRANHAPVIDATDPSGSEVSINVQSGQTASQTFKVTQYHDPDNPAAGQTLTFKWYKKDGAAGQYTEITGLQDPTICGLLGLGLGEHYVKVTLTDNGTPAMSTSFEWHVTVTGSPQTNHAPVIDTTDPSGSEVTINVQSGQTASQTFKVTQYHDPDNVDPQHPVQTLTFKWYKKDGAAGQYTEITGLQDPATCGLLGLGLGEHYVKVTLTDNGTPAMSASFEWHVTVTENAPASTITASAGTGGSINPSGQVSVAYGANQPFTVTPDPGYIVDQVLVDGASATLTGGTYTFTNVTAAHTISASFIVAPSITDQLIHDTFQYFWNETNNPATGFTRDRLAVDPANRNSTYDSKYNMASMSATGFSLSAMCVAAEKYGDGTNPDWTVTKDELKARVALIFDKLIEIQGNQNPADPAAIAKWGRDGLFYHFVNIDTGERWDGAEVSTIDTAILVAGVLTAGEYFGGDLKDKALQIYTNVNWKAFLDTNKTAQNENVVANPYYNQLYHAWTPEITASTDANGFTLCHWDYTSECLLLYLLATSSPDSNHAIPRETFYAFRRELASYGANGNPMVKSWFGSLFVYQYTQAFFNFKDAGGQPLYDKEGVDWWQNSVEATKANKQYCNDNQSMFAGSEDLWGLTSGYAAGFTYNVYGAPPAEVFPSTEVHGADGTIFPAAAGGSLAILPEECIRALNKMKELYDTYNYQIWGDYGFVDSFRLGSDLNQAPFPISSFYAAIDAGISLVMAENHNSGLIWNNFAGFEIAPGKTLKDTIIQNIGFTTDKTCIVTVDDPNPDANFHMGQIDATNSLYTIQFDLPAVVDNKPYLLAIHSYRNQNIGDHTINVDIKVNNLIGASFPFIYKTGENPSDLIEYIPIDPVGLKAGTNVMTFEWKGSTAPEAQWFAWKNIEISSPAAHDTWVAARNTTADPKVLFANEYRVDNTYYAGADINTFAQALNKDTENFTDVLFYNENTDYAALTFRILETQNKLKNNLQIFINGAAAPFFDGQVSEGDQVTTPVVHLERGWNKITLYNPGVTVDTAPSEWLRWDAISLAEAIPTVLDAPVGFAGASFGKDKARLKWISVGGAAKYNIYRSSSQGGPYSLAGSVDAPATTYEDPGLSNNTPYYYVVRSAKADNSESVNSLEVKVTTGPYQLDYNDGHDPNVFGGATLADNGAIIGDMAFTGATRYNGETGKVRKVVLQAGQKNTITLNNSNISDATMLSFRIKGGNGGEKFIVSLKDSSNAQTQMTFTVATGGAWQEMHILLSDFPATINLSSIAAIDIISAAASPITIYFDEMEFDVVDLTGDKLDIIILTGSSDTPSTGIDFGLATANNPEVLANQYLKINYKSSGTWGIQIYTDNKAADAYPKYTGTGDQVNGLIGVSNSGYRVPVIWQVWDQLKGYYNGTETPKFDTTVDDGNRAEFAFVMDKSDPDWAKDQYVRNYRTIINSNGELGAPVPLANPPPGYWPRTATVGNPVYVYLAADFTGAPWQTYATNKLTIDIYHS